MFSPYSHVWFCDALMLVVITVLMFLISYFVFDIFPWQAALTMCCIALVGFVIGIFLRIRENKKEGL